ncbi:MAG TPA: FAD-binding oxidoreductase [Solirubrobacterales bacterium]|nr:FAD-binding oxidoreductase [Solirubrobacterales bacterium]
MKWWGWGDPERRLELPRAAVAALRGELGVAADDATVPVELEQVSLPEPRPVPDRVRSAAGEVLDRAEDRLRRCAGRSYPDLVRLRSGKIDAAPDAVLRPADPDAIEAVLAACSDEEVAVVPYGGGTSVVGGLDPIADGHRCLVSLDLARLRGVELDRTSLTARLGPGLSGPQAEAALGAQGVTLGHFPQSFEQATIGGYAATRSAGQASTGYGRFDDLVAATELCAPAGRLRTLQVPHTAAGPSLRELVIGSEGTLGVITDLTCRVRPAPERRLYEAWVAEDFGHGREIVRDLAQRHEAPDVLRLSDAEETRVSLDLAGTEGLRKRALDAYLSIRRRSGGSLLICGWEGESASVGRRRSLGRSRLRRGGAVPLGTSAGRSWERSRYTGPYLRDELMNLGALVETLETAHTWSRLDELYHAVGTALQAALGDRAIVMCHVSHAYADGASLYFTFIARAKRGRKIEQWREAKSAACEAIVGAEGTITHHHAVGRDHAPYMAAEVGPLGVDILRAVKERLDPAGIMNPGKLIPAA